MENQFPNFPEGERRIHLVPDYAISNLAKYRDLSKERQQLSLWRAWRTNGFRVKKRESNRKTKYHDDEIALRILFARDIIKLNVDDYDMLLSLVATSEIREKAVDYVSKNQHILELCMAGIKFNKTYKEVKEFAIKYAAVLFLEEYKSLEEVNAKFANAVWDFVNSEN